MRPVRRIPLTISMTDPIARVTRPTTTVPTMAAVLVSALLLTMAMATGTSPRLAPGMAMHAMLLGGSGGQHHDAPLVAVDTPDPTPRRTDGIATRRPRATTLESFLASAPTMPGRGNLPPPTTA